MTPNNNSSQHKDASQVKEKRRSSSASDSKDSHGSSARSSSRRKKERSNKDFPADIFRNNSSRPSASKSRTSGRSKKSMDSLNSTSRRSRHSKKKEGSRSQNVARRKVADSNRSRLNSSHDPGDSNVKNQFLSMENEAEKFGAVPPSPMMQGSVGRRINKRGSNEVHHNQPNLLDERSTNDHDDQNQAYQERCRTFSVETDGTDSFQPVSPFPHMREHRHATQPSNGYYPQDQTNFAPYPYNHTPEPLYHHMSPNQYFPQMSMHPMRNYGSTDFYSPQFSQFMANDYQRGPPFYGSPIPMNPTFSDATSSLPPPESPLDDGAEPVITQAGNFLHINIADDQIIRSMRACLSRPGFIHAVVAFAVSGIVINTLSTYMDYFVGIGGSGRYLVGIVGFSFQAIIMISSIIVGRFTDRTRAYFSVIIALLVLGACALAECGVNLDAERGTGLKWSLLITAVMIGPLQPVATEMGVDVAYPLSENTVLVIQQLFSNFLSALFIPFFQRAKDFDMSSDNEFERPQYTFSFYMLIFIHAVSTVYFATFNGVYKRHEYEKKRDNETENDKQNQYDDVEQQSLLTKDY